MNLPKKTQISNRNHVFIQDENGKNLLIASAWISEDYQKLVMDAMCKRYNSYNSLVIALTIVSTLLVATGLILTFKVI